MKEFRDRIVSAVEARGVELIEIELDSIGMELDFKVKATLRRYTDGSIHHVEFNCRACSSEQEAEIRIVSQLIRAIDVDRLKSERDLRNKHTVMIGLKTDLMAIRTDNKHPVIDAILAELTPEQTARIAIKIEGGAL